MVKVKAQMDQFAEGLDELGVMRLIRRFPELSKPLFVAVSKPISAGVCVCVCVCFRLNVYACMFAISYLTTNNFLSKYLPPRMVVAVRCVCVCLCVCVHVHVCVCVCVCSNPKLRCRRL